LLPVLSDAYFFLKSQGFRPQAGAEEEGLPPASLRLSSAGTSDPRWFLESGTLAQQTLADVLRDHGQNSPPRAVLDFGCGCGRVLRHAKHRDATKYVGIDWNRRAIRWCQKNLPFADFFRGELLPPLPPELGPFDLIYAFSVFTHLPLEAQEAWTRTLADHLHVGGLLVLSTHGDAFLDDLSATELAQYRSGEIVLREPIAAGTNACAAYHPGESLLQVCPPHLQKVSFLPQGARGNPPQDLWVLRRE
jgi:SAM-dependent methyltransferase